MKYNIMALQNKPVDSIQRMISTLKHFEKKLDKIQNDMNYQGQTLSDLRDLVLNLSSGNIAIAIPDTKSEGVPGKRLRRRTMAIQYEDNNLYVIRDPPIEINSSVLPVQTKQSLLPKVKTQSLQNQNNVNMDPSLDTSLDEQAYKMEGSHTIIQKHRKGDPLRKAKQSRKKVPKKITENKSSSLQKKRWN